MNVQAIFVTQAGGADGAMRAFVKFDGRGAYLIFKYITGQTMGQNLTQCLNTIYYIWMKSGSEKINVLGREGQER